MTHSKAFEQFEGSLGMAKELLKLEKGLFRNPPRSEEQSAVRGLRSGVAVIVVASFESFLRDAIEEHLSDLSSRQFRLSLEKLPEKIRVNHVYNSLDRAMKGPPFQVAPPKADRLPDIERVCKIVISGNIDPKVFCDTGSNPNSKNLRRLFANIALDNITILIKTRFDRKWGQPTSHTFIDDKLDEIVNRRHIVAHTADALSITRTDLRESVKFIRILALMLDLELTRHIKSLIRSCT